MSDFDRPIDRRFTHSLKWEKYGDKDILPLWVADTDFMAPPAIIAALHERIEHGVFGYTLVSDELEAIIAQRLQQRYRWTIRPDWLVWMPGMVSGLNIACRATGQSGSGVISPKPVYPPFMSAPSLSDRQLISTPMVADGDRWVIDFDALEQAITPACELLLFCNPHNPGGTVYRREELERLLAICTRHDLVLCSDEIHCDLILEPGIEHIPLASLDPELAKRTITLMAPSKTYNIAGLACSFAVIPDPALRARFRRVMKGIVPDVNLLGLTAALAAYRDCEPWSQQLLAYLRGNRDYLVEEINRIPGLSLRPFEATYLAWIDVSALALDNPPAFFEAAGVGLSPGADFGDARFMRLNFGCPRTTLETALSRIRAAIEGRVQG
ncbi:MalY/PatB family protein [Aestuariirhabdus litorea]|uniref:cysteine-S-conjugate beta-lyase n=1 Tax=Aestuariirhabdus litorea TaxID=2528527 RepID=A0A3P3VI88_9GAMM|nr:PatB family C-S lyase [Aestuariirhabdus litorea]RRJ82445.1 putative C-S lyase [Aestuariirhabdus litorea]RWW92607.1 putative C-S lyase [Endozoicomonadaceae bacterium GTF-13]